MENEALEKKLASAIEKAIGEANICYLHKKVKTTRTEYDEEMKKPIEEITEECDYIEKTKCEYDVSKIKTLTEMWLKLKESDVKKDIENNLSGVVILPETEFDRSDTE